MIPAGETSLLPRWLWRAVLWGLVALIMAGVGGTLLLAGGAADVPRAGPLQWERAATSPDCLDVDALVMSTLTPLFTIELIADVLPDSEFVTWGVWLGTPDSVWRWEVLPPGYYSHRGQTYSFHHVRIGENELRLDVIGDQYTLRLNREWANAGQIVLDGDGWGLLWDDGVCWRRVSVFADEVD